jgi:hypothetical protein
LVLGLFLDRIFSISERMCIISERDRKAIELEVYFKFPTTADVF